MPATGHPSPPADQEPRADQQPRADQEPRDDQQPRAGRERGADQEPPAESLRAGRGVVRPDAPSLKALAHPLRLQLLGLLRMDGPATASQLAVRTGQSSGTTSYHLRQLAAHGFVLEDEARGTGRDRWWRAAHSSTVVEVPPEADEEQRAVRDEYLRVVAERYGRKIETAVAGLATLNDDLGPGWDQAFTISDVALRLTREEAVSLVAELEALAARYRPDDPERRDAAPAGAERVVLQFQVMPTPAPAPLAGEEGLQ